MIRIEGISKEFKSGRGLVKALRDVSLTIEKETTVAVVGKSGSGKTTLLNCMGGLERPDKGKVTCFDMPIHSLRGDALSLFQRRSRLTMHRRMLWLQNTSESRLWHLFQLRSV